MRTEKIVEQMTLASHGRDEALAICLCFDFKVGWEAVEWSYESVYAAWQRFWRDVVFNLNYNSRISPNQASDQLLRY